MLYPNLHDQFTILPSFFLSCFQDDVTSIVGEEVLRTSFEKKKQDFRGRGLSRMIDPVHT